MPSDPSASSVNCAAILEAVNVARGVLFTFALEAQRTFSLMLCKRALAKEESCRDSSWVGARTSALGFTARCGWDDIVAEVDPEETSSDCLRWWSMGRRYAIDFPDPVSEARRYCRHSGASENKCFRDNP